MSINIPDDPAPNGYVPFPFEAELEAAIEYFRTESVSKTDWEEIKTGEQMSVEDRAVGFIHGAFHGMNADPKHGVLAQKKKNDTAPIPLVRGCGIYKDTTPAQLLSVFTLGSVRLVFDDYTESVSVLQKYGQRLQKFYSVQKYAAFPSQLHYYHFILCIYFITGVGCSFKLAMSLALKLCCGTTTDRLKSFRLASPTTELLRQSLGKRGPLLPLAVGHFAQQMVVPTQK